MYHELDNEDFMRELSKSVPALIWTVLPVTMAILRPDPRELINDPASERTPSPMSIFLGNSVRWVGAAAEFNEKDVIARTN
jgi:hypothetical protein